MRVLPRPLKLQRSKVGGKAGDDTCHFPWSFPLHRRPLRATLAGAIVLAEATRRIGCAADVVGFAILRSEQIAAVEGWNWPVLDLDELRRLHQSRLVVFDGDVE